MNTTDKPGKSVPLLNIAPQFKHPLSPWNPLDYLRLLYWIFFSPQSLRHYVITFEKPVRYRLVVQAEVAFSLTSIGICLGLAGLGIPVNLSVLAVGIVIGILLGVIVGIVFGITFGVSFGVTFGTVGSVAAAIIFGIQGSLQVSPTFGMALGMVLGASAGAALNAVSSIKSGVEDSIINTVTGGIVFIVVGGFIFAVTGLMALTTTGVTVNILVSNLNTAALFSIGLGIAFCVSLSRLPDYLILSIPGALYWYGSGKRRALNSGHVLFLSLPGIGKRLEHWLESDWEAGLHNANQLLAYTLQFAPVIKAVDAVLARSSPDTLLSRVNILVEQSFDWSLLRYCCISLRSQLWKNAIDGLFFLFPRGKRPKLERFSSEPRIDTPARAVCAGFWHWHREDLYAAEKAFAKIQELYHGTELYYIASALVQALDVDKDGDEDKSKVEMIAEWEEKTRRLENLPDPELRRGTLKVLRELRKVSAEVRKANHACSPFKRSQIMIRCINTLTLLKADNDDASPQPETLELDKTFCGGPPGGGFSKESPGSQSQDILPKPEGSLIIKILQKWQTLLTGSGCVIPGEELHQPVNNPYDGYSGRPTAGSTFTGRKGIMERIEHHWAAGGLLEPLVLFGHRRMGKTSILRSLEQNNESHMLLVYLTMQDIGLVDHTGQIPS